MNISTRIFFIFLIILSLLSAIILSMGQLANSRKQSAEIILLQYQYHTLVEHLQQKSDDLTKMARTYVMTGNNIYKQYYDDIWAIQDGQASHPIQYKTSYWGFEVINQPNMQAQGAMTPLINLMDNAGLTLQELLILRKIIKYTKELSKMEKVAFSAMEGIFPDDNGKLVITGDPDPALARNLLYNAQYLESRAKIMQPIREFNDLINERISLNAIKNKEQGDLYWNITTLLVVITILFSLLAFFYFRTKVVAPIVALSNIAQRILSGALGERAIVGSHDEIGDLNDAFNKMIEARIQIEFELQNNEQSLRTTLNSIGDALIATDIYGCVIRMNPVAEKLTGWNMDEAQGKPLTEVFHIINATTRKTVMDPANKVLGSGKVVDLASHTILISKDGTEHQISDSAAPIRDDDNDVTGVVLVFRDITAEHTVQQELHKSKERFQRLFENAEVSIWNEDMSAVLSSMNTLREEGVTDLRQYLIDNPQAAWDMLDKLRVIQVNKATLKLFKAKTHDCFLHTIHKTFGPNTIQTFIEELCAIWDKKKIYRSEADFLTFDGETINTIISFQIPETDEEFKSIPVSIIDITELKLAEMAQKESEERLSLHQESSPLGVISWDKSMTCTQWNPAAEKIFGYTEDEVLGHHCMEMLVPPNFNDEMAELRKKIIQNTRSTHSINENITKDGRIIVCEWFNTPLINEKGVTIGITTIVQDITKHKIIEDKLRILSRAVEQSPASIIITNTDGAIEYVNPKFEDSTGYSAKEVMGKNPRFLSSGHTSQEEYAALWNNIVSGKKWHGEFHNKRKDGSLFWEFTSISCITDKKGTTTHFLAVNEDITERKKIEEHLRRSQKMEAVGELAGGIAHDFNNLLGVIIGNIDLMKRKVEEGSKLQQHMEKAQNAALRGSSLTQRLLNFAHQRPEIGKLANVNKTILNLEDLVGKSMTSKISLETNLADDLWMVELNTGDFEDMLINLSLNARDAMPNGGRLIIETHNKLIDLNSSDHTEKLEPGEYVEITVSDTGTGIPKDITTKIFDPFFTTKEKDKGTGLGLAMVYGFIQRTKGRITVYSEVGIGTTFKIHLPRSHATAEPILKPVKTDIALPEGTESILIVDDEKELTVIASNILEKLGYKTICVYNADEALHILETKKIDLLFSDIVMTGPLNGFDLANIASKEYPKLNILLTSGFVGKMQDSEEIEKWGSKIIAKPYRNSELAIRIRETLDKRM
ncbi:MAG: PAS domain S-box protein [Emcibacter sp.]|nr:PAS domain S-box protein [Emcibacter sp.]